MHSAEATCPLLLPSSASSFSSASFFHAANSTSTMPALKVKPFRRHCRRAAIFPPFCEGAYTTYMLVNSLHVSQGKANQIAQHVVFRHALSHRNECSDSWRRFQRCTFRRRRRQIRTGVSRGGVKGGGITMRGIRHADDAVAAKSSGRVRNCTCYCRE